MAEATRQAEGYSKINAFPKTVSHTLGRGNNPVLDVIDSLLRETPKQLEDRWAGGLKAKTKHEEDLFDKMSAQLGFDIRGELNSAQMAAVHRIAGIMRKEMENGLGTLGQMESRVKATRTLINLLESDHHSRADIVQKTFALHYRRFYPKDIAVPAGYYDPRLLTGPFICADIMRMDHDDGGRNMKQETSRQQVQGIVIAGYLWAKIKCPTFFLSKGLAEAIDATDLPDDYSPPPLKWPLPAFTVMMGKGMLRFKDQDVAAVIYARAPKTEPIKIGRPVFDGGAFDRMHAETWSCVDIEAIPPPDEDTTNLPADPHAGLQLLTFVLANGDTVSREFLDYCPMDISDNRFILGATSESSGPLRNDSKLLMLYAVKLLLVLQHSPHLVERTSSVVQEPGRSKRSQFDPNAKWSANFMGRNYRMRGADGVAGDGNKRPHLRRGHARRQRYGPGRTLIRDKWIEPVFVNGSKWKPGDPLHVDGRDVLK